MRRSHFPLWLRLCRLARLFVPLVVALSASLAPSLGAQTYNPKQIRFEGGGDPAELLRLSGLTPGKPLNKAEIDAAMSKLADTGAFAELSYTVSAEALVIKLGGAAEASGQALPVRYVNFVWWQPDELTKLLEQRVPLFHGELPLTGSLTDKVCAALVQLLAERGVPDAKVEALTTTLGGKAGGAKGVSAIALDIKQPAIVLGNLLLPGAAPSTQKQLDVVTNELGIQEFQTDVTAKAIRDNVADTEKNAGYLETAVDCPVFSPPRKDMNGYAVDATAAVHPGELYRVGSIDFGAKPPLTEAESLAAVDLKPGQPAGAMAMRIATGELQRAYIGRGRLEASLKLQSTIDHTAHTVALRFLVEPGELYHLAGVDTSALPADMQAAFANHWRGKPGMEAGLPLGRELAKTLAEMNATHSVRLMMRPDFREHTVTVVLRPASAGSAPQRPD